MRLSKNSLAGFIASAALLTIIIDAQTATRGIFDGIQICIQTVIPAIFPFLILVPVICRQFTDYPLRFMAGIRRLCQLPDGAETILFFGWLGGYPMGAALISEAYNNKLLSKVDAQRMMGFCSNAGPAFLFGMVGPLFNNKLIPWLLWFIHIISAITVGYLTRADSAKNSYLSLKGSITIVEQIEKSIKTMATICAWVVLFRMISTFLTKWILRYFPVEIQSIIIGFLEMSNGCIMLIDCPDEIIKFLISSCLLAFGGFCVLLQTKSVCKTIGLGNYFPGKVLQCSVSVLLSGLFLPILYKLNAKQYTYIICSSISALIVSYFLMKKRKKLWKINPI